MKKSEMETIILFNEEDDEATVETYNKKLQARMSDLEIEPEDLDGGGAVESEDGMMRYTTPKSMWIGAGAKVKRISNRPERTPEEKIEKTRQLRVGKTIKRLMDAGGKFKTREAAQKEAERIYGKAGHATKAAHPGQDPFKNENAPHKAETKAEAEVEADETETVEDAPETPVVSSAKAKAIAARKAADAKKGKGTKNAGLE
jgi:hypothetical protein